jgi:hypothetical protein
MAPPVAAAPEPLQFFRWQPETTSPPASIVEPFATILMPPPVAPAPLSVRLWIPTPNELTVTIAVEPDPGLI